MIRDIDQIKLNAFKHQAQIAFFEPEGKLVSSCHTLVAIDPDRSVYDQFAFLESLKDIFMGMTDEDEYDFPAVEWDEGAEGLFHLHFKLVADDEKGSLIQWTLIDKTEQYDQLLQLQQGRNDHAISEEFALIQKRVAEVEKELLAFRNEELERIQEFKTDFFAKMSHEMRTPLNSISGLVSLLMEDGSKSEAYLPALQATSRHLNSIINDILDLSKIDAGKLAFESLDFDLTELAANIARGFEYVAAERTLDLHLELPEAALYVKGDPTRIAQVLYNLLGNSLKFTEKGYVSLSITSKESSDDHLQLTIKVEDSGIGMDPEKISELLEPYEQANDSTARLYGGTGLGLHISLKLIQAMGSQLEIRSGIGQGTKMSFTLNLPKGKANAITDSDEPIDLTGRRLLVAEDDAVNRKILEEQLGRLGASLTMLGDGAALEKALQEEDCDLVITDINLPEKTGLEVFKAAREASQDVPFLFISGSALEAEKDLQAYEAWDFATKPIEMADVKRRIAAMLPKAFPTDLNLEKLKEMIGGDMNFFTDLVQTILDTLPEELKRLKAALQTADDTNAGKVLHKIRPSIEYLGIPALSKERYWLHKQAEAGKLEGEFTARAVDFDSWVKQVLKKLSQEI